MREAARGGRWRRVAPAAAVVLVLGAGTVAARTAAAGTPADQYRTARVTRGDVAQQLALTGTVQQVGQQDVAFAVAGTVRTVAVAVGDQVRAGQVLATLDTRPLSSAVTQSEATLAQAQAALESDSAATTTAATSTGGGSGTTGPRTSTGPSASSGASGSTGSTKAAQAVAGAQRAVQADLRAAGAAMRSESAACAPVMGGSAAQPTSGQGRGSGPAPTGRPTPTGSPSGHPTATPTATGSSTSPSPSPTAQGPSSQDVARCVATLRTWQGAQATVARDQQALALAEGQLAQAGQGSRTPSGGSSAGAAASTSGGSTSRSSTTAGASTGAVGAGSNAGASTARLITDQAAVNDDELALSQAEAALTAATLTAPAGGTVAAVSLTPGAAAGTASGVVISRPGSAEVTAAVPLAQMPRVRVGQDALVTPAGATSPVDGTVSAIGLLPVSGTAGSGSGTAYPVAVLVPQAPAALATGSRAAVSIVVATAHRVLTVPTSAVTTGGAGRAFVLTLSHGVATRTAVTVGAVGTTTTEVRQGLSLGQTVVLADLSTPLPSNTNGLRGLRGGGFGGGAGGFGGGGAPGGGGGAGASGGARSTGAATR